MTEDDQLLAVYNRKLIALSGEASSSRHLENPDLRARAVSPVCGSEVEVELKLSGDRISAFGYDIDACALTRAVVAVMARAIVGKTREDTARAGAVLRAMLQEGGAPPSGDWQDLGVLVPVKDYKARHDSVLMPFEAVEKAFDAKK